MKKHIILGNNGTLKNTEFPKGTTIFVKDHCTIEGCTFNG